MELLAAGFVYLAAAVIAVPLANRLGLGSVLGYLIAGVIIGPFLGVVGQEATEVQHFAEFGVVMMLFLVGLELQPSQLWAMRYQLAGLGGLQVVLSTVAIGGVAWCFGLAWQSALALGMILALSSTAIVLQTLHEKGLMTTHGGQSAFSVLLTQDIAVIPMLALMPLLAVTGASQGHEGSQAAHGDTEASTHGQLAHLFSTLPDWLQVVVILTVIGGIILAGRLLMRPLLRFIAQSGLREIFTAAALLLVIGIALLMSLVGLSPALGTFLAGVVLSDSEYRHELESDVEPFKGLLLGLFFITVGATIDVGLLMSEAAAVVSIALGLLLLKGSILFALASLFGLRGANRWLFTLGLAQAGEFAFVLFAFATSSGVLDDEITRIMTLAVALTMLMTPLLFILFEKVLAPRAQPSSTGGSPTIDQRESIVVAGMGRFGQIVARLLTSRGHEVTILDHDPETIEHLARIGFRVYYGDATRPDLLESAGLPSASLLIAALDDRDKQTRLVEQVANRWPNVTVLARAHDRHHVYELEKAGAHHVERETFESALHLGGEALTVLGEHPFAARKATNRFRQHDLQSLNELRAAWEEEGVSGRYIDAMRAQHGMLVQVMQSDRKDDALSRSERGWTPPPQGDATQ